VYFQARVVTQRVPADWRDSAPAAGALALIVLAGIAGLILARRPGNRVGWVMILATFTAWFSFIFAPDYGAYGIYIAPGSLPAPLLPSFVAGTTFGLFFGLVVVVLPLVFPEGRLLSRRWSWVLVLVGAGILLTMPSALDPAYFASDHLANPYSLSAFRGYAEGVLPGVGAMLASIAGLLSAASVIVRYRRSSSEVRHQIKWFAAAIALVVMIFAFQTVTRLQNGPGLPLALAALGGSIAVAVLKYRLYDIDVVISRALVYGSLAAFITAVYVAIVVGVGSLVGSGGKPNLVLSIAATAIVAVAFQPVRERLQRIANRLVYGKRATPYEVLSQFSERVAESYASDEVLPRMARVLAEGTAAVRAGVWLRVGDLVHESARWPGDSPDSEPARLVGGALTDMPGTERAVPVQHQGELLGALTVTKRTGESLTPVEEKLLLDLASQAGLVLKNVGLTDELLQRLEDLRASRQRLVAAQDDERRRLERNLHDGAQQNLVALKVKLGLAEMLADKDMDKSRALLSELQADADEALETLRSLARGIYPPLLADKGLVAALESQARKATLPVHVEADHIGRYPQETEAAVYFCVLEALQNVQKYAHATHASVRLSQEDGVLSFAVEDDGDGFDPETVERGAGLTNMADRLEALGGELKVAASAGSGTRLIGLIGLASTAVAAS